MAGCSRYGSRPLAVLRAIVWAAAIWTLGSGVTENATAQENGAESADEAFAWSIERYQALSGALEAAEEAILLETPNTDAWIEARHASLESKRALLAYVSGVLRAGNMPEALRPDAERARYLLIQNVIASSAELGLCDGLDATLSLLNPVANSPDPELALAHQRAVASVADCLPAESETEEEAVVTLVPEPTPAPTPAGPELVRYSPARARGLNIVGQVAFGVGGTVMVAGLTWDFVSARTTRSEFIDMRDACEAPASPDCDYDELVDLRNTVEASRAPILAMSIGGAVVGAAGLTMWVIGATQLAEIRSQRTVTATPGTAAGPLGATLHVRF
jgi:hypothetical protein